MQKELPEVKHLMQSFRLKVNILSIGDQNSSEWRILDFQMEIVAKRNPISYFSEEPTRR